MIDLNKPLELFNPKTGETKDATFQFKYSGVELVSVRPGVMSSGWSDYYLSHGGSRVPDQNPWHLRNKVDVNLDLSKPLYVDGVRVYLVNTHDSDRNNLDFWIDIWKRHEYVNVSKFHQARDQSVDNSTFVKKTLQAQLKTCAIQGTISNNKGTNMLDLNKALTVDGKDAKVIHTFPTGNVAVVVEGDTDVHTFTPEGNNVKGTYGYGKLVNKVVETVRYVNVYPTSSATYTHTSLANAKKEFSRGNGALQIKQTLIDGKVVKNEIVTD